jgi:hypothetical protein
VVAALTEDGGELLCGGDGQPAGINSFRAQKSLAVRRFGGKWGKEEGSSYISEGHWFRFIASTGTNDPFLRFYHEKTFLFSILTFCFHFNRKKTFFYLKFEKTFNRKSASI